jgi:predicted pyridoxine 5'-phosphate oxidase superfamily flavin-nucleotide-binding protein
MSHRFAEIMFTDGVKVTQGHYGTRAHNERFEQNGGPNNVLTAREIEFIGARDGFYMATVTETGWPYVQFRGGPRGFVKVLDEHTLGYADFRGNLQYISMGNLTQNDRVAVFFMDYRNRVRLKLLGRARVEDVAHNLELAAKLEMPAYRAQVERAVRITVEAFDWNCPRHIAPKFAEDEVERMIAPLRARIAELEIALSRASTTEISK